MTVSSIPTPLPPRNDNAKSRNIKTLVCLGLSILLNILGGTGIIPPIAGGSICPSIVGE